MSQEMEKNKESRMQDVESKEIDLIQLFTVLGEKSHTFTIIFLRLVKRFVRFNLRNWFVCGLFLILAALGFYYKAFVKPNLTTQYVLVLKGVSYVEVENKILVLQNYVNPPSRNKELIEVLNLDSSCVAPIRGFYTYNCIDQNEDGTADCVGTIKDDWDSLPRIIGNQLAVSIALSGMSDLKQLGDAVIDYLNSDSMLQRTYRNYVTVHEEEIKFDEQEMFKLDSLRKTGVLSGNMRQRPVSYSQGGSVYEGGAYTQDLLDLSRNISSIKLNLGTQDQPVRSTSSLAIIETPSKLFVLLRYALPIYLIGFVLAWFISERKRIFRFIKSA